MVKYFKKGDKTPITTHFLSAEFDCKGKGCCQVSKIDTAFVEKLERIRRHFNAPVVINSGYRCKTHNQKVGGASSSRHLKGEAVDIVIKGVAPKKTASYAEHIGIKGIGLYNNFVHLDSRSKKSFWYSHKEYYRSGFGGSNPHRKPLLNIKFTSFGEGVKWLQWELEFFGFDCGGVDGVCGSRTESALKSFQERAGLTADGICGSKTRKALSEF